MPIIWCSISAHGFGHAAQTIPILNALGATLDDVHVILRTCVPPAIFHEYLTVKWDVQAVPQDIGCIQQGPLDIDVPGTWDAYQEFHGNWTQRVNQEAEAIHEAQVDLVISNISYLAIAGAFQAHRPVVAIASLCWDQVLLPFVETSNDDHQVICEHIRLEYPRPISWSGFILPLTCLLSLVSLIRGRLFLWSNHRLRIFGSFWA